MAGIQPLPEGVSVDKARAELQSQLPAGFTPVYMSQLELLYAAREMKPMWENRDAVKAFQQQLAEVAIAGFQPQFTTQVALLTDPAVTGQARDIVLSDAMMGYLHFIANIPVKGNRWLYSDKPYALTTPPISVINQWQVALDNGQLTSFVASLAPQHPQYAAMHESLLKLVGDTRPRPQLTSTATLRPGSGVTTSLRCVKFCAAPGCWSLLSVRLPKKAVALMIVNLLTQLSGFRRGRGLGPMARLALPRVTG